MKKKRNQRPPRKMNPVFLIFCEGETEETYINFLRKSYKLPTVKVMSHKADIFLSPRVFQSYIKIEKIDRNDKIMSFLMYDLDRKGIIEKIIENKGYINISSSPAIELWFLLHEGEQKAAISTDSCIEKLKKLPVWENYKKGTFSEKQKQILWNNRGLASERAKRLQENENPSSLVYKLIEMMDKALNT